MQVPPPILKPRLSNSTASTTPASTLGIRLSALLRFAEDVPAGMSTAEAVRQYVLPQTAKLQCRYVDLLADGLTGTPDVYIVHCWQMGFRSMAETVRRHFEHAKQSQDGPHVWIDIFCVNQHVGVGVADAGATPSLIRGADKASPNRICNNRGRARAVISTPRRKTPVNLQVVFVLDRRGACLSRTWVLYELWAATLLPDAAIGAAAAGSAGVHPRRGPQLIVLLEALGDSSSWAHLSHAYAALDIRSSEGGCRHPGDEAGLVEGMMAGGAGALSPLVERMMAGGAGASSPSSAAAVAASTASLSRVVHRIKVSGEKGGT